MAGSRIAVGAALAAVAFTTALVVAADTPNSSNRQRQFRSTVSVRCSRIAASAAMGPTRPSERRSCGSTRAKARCGARGRLGVVKPGDPDKSELIRRIINETTKSGCRRRSRTVASPAERDCFGAGSPRAPTTGRTGRSFRSARFPFLRPRMNALPRTRSTRSCARGSHAEGLLPRPRHRPRCCCGAWHSTSPACRRRSPRSTRSSPIRRRPPTSGWSIATSRRRPTASGWPMDWLDLARYADTYGYQNDCRPRHVAVSRLGHPGVQPAICRTTSSSPGSSPAICCPTPTREQRLATAFNRLHLQTNEGGSVEEEFRAEYVVDRVNTFGTALLGPDARVRALPRPQVRPDHPARLLLALRLLQQHRRVRALLALHQRDAHAVAAALDAARRTRGIASCWREIARV